VISREGKWKLRFWESGDSEMVEWGGDGGRGVKFGVVFLVSI